MKKYDKKVSRSSFPALVCVAACDLAVLVLFISEAEAARKEFDELNNKIIELDNQIR